MLDILNLFYYDIPDSFFIFRDHYSMGVFIKKKAQAR